MKLLGTPPDQITEDEKMIRLQDIADRMVALDRTTEKFFEELIKLNKEEQELDRKYPSTPP